MCPGFYPQYGRAGTATHVYRRRRPERTALYRLVQQHLETWVAHRSRARSGTCGHDFLVAFSCNGRRMAETAAHLVEQAFPQVTLRQ